MVISEQNYAMLLTEAKIREIIPPRVYGFGNGIKIDYCIVL